MNKFKKLTALILSVSTMLALAACGNGNGKTESSTVSAADKQSTEVSSDSGTEWAENYREYLKHYLHSYNSDENENEETTAPQFTLAYLDGDSIPEVLILEESSKFGKLTILTNSADGVTEIDTSDTLKGSHTYYVEKSNEIVELISIKDRAFSSVYKLENNKLVEIFSAAMPLSEEYDYLVNGEDVDENTYIEEIKKNIPQPLIPVGENYEAESFPQLTFKDNAEMHEMTVENIDSFVK